MYSFLLSVHSIFRWVILILLFAAIFKSIADRNKPFTKSHTTLGLVLMIFCDLMLLVGLYQWITGPWGLKLIQNTGMKGVMHNNFERFFAVEHITGMIVAIILVHVGRSYAKRSIPDKTKHARTLLFYGLALLIILISIPWPFREVGAGRHWFPGMG